MRSTDSKRHGRTGAGRAGVLGAVVMVGCVVVACSGSPTSTTTPRPSRTEPAKQWRFRSLSDMDPVRDLVSTEEHLWVATPGGLLRYSIDGGRPLRVTGAAGPGGDRVVGVAADDQGRVWALSEGGLARFDRGAWSRPTGPLPDVGELTSLAVGADGAVWVGGSQGLIHHDGESWSRWFTDAEVSTLALSPDEGGGVWVGTRTEGVRHLAPDGVISEHISDRGMPCHGIRSLVTTEGGGLWAICQRGNGSVLAHFDGTRWNAMTAELSEQPLDLARSRHRIILLTTSHLWRITDREPEQELGPGSVPLTEIFRGDPARPRRQQSRPTPATGEPGEREVGLGLPPADFAPPIELPPPSPNAPPPPPPYLRPIDVQVRQGAALVECDERGIWIGTQGLGAIRVMGRDEEMAYRTLDLLVTERPFSVAADGEGHAWFLTRDLRAGQLSGRGLRFEPVQIEEDPTAGVQLLSFGSRGFDAYAFGRFRGRNLIRIYQHAGGRWVELLTRELDLGGGAGEAEEEDGGEDGEAPSAEPRDEALFEFSFFEVDPRGRFWIGLRVREPGASSATPRGVAVIDLETEESTYHGREPRGPGAVRIPDDVAMVAFTSAGDAWLGGLNGAVLLGEDGTVEEYTEANGLRGGIVNDLAVDDRDVVWVATPSGVGRYQENRWRFFLDDWPEDMHVGSLAFDSHGELWTGGNRGAVHYNGDRWETITEDDGLLANRIRSVHVDGQDRVWFVTEAGISLLLRE